VAVRGSSLLRGHHWEWEGYRGGCVRLGCSIVEVGNFLSKGIDSFAECIESRPVVLIDLIDHFHHDHILFAGGCSSNLQFLVYFVEKVQEIGTGKGVLQETLINVWEA